MSRQVLRLLPSQVGHVQQNATAIALDATEFDEGISKVVSALTSAADEADVGPFTPNEVMFQHYEGVDSGVGPHRDHVRYERFVVVFSLEGRAIFRVHGEGASGDDEVSFGVEARDIVILRGSRPDESEARLRHQVGPPIDTLRTSLTFRQRRVATQTS